MTTNQTCDRNKAIYRRYIQQVFNEGQITDSWVKNDVMGLMNQLGADSASQ